MQHQMELLNRIAEYFVNNEYRLLIIDSIMACFRVDYVGRGELNERQQKLNQFLSKLTHLAEEFNIAVLMVCCSLTQPHPPINEDRPIRYRVTLALVLCSQAQMAVKPSEAIFSLMHLRPEYSSAKGAVRSALLRFRILQTALNARQHTSSLMGVSTIQKNLERMYISSKFHVRIMWEDLALWHCILLHVTSMAASEFSRRIKRLLLLLRVRLLSHQETHHQTSALRIDSI